MRREQFTGHPDQVRWNAKYTEGPPAPRPHRLARQALAMDLPDGPVADLACGPSGSALLAARAVADGGLLGWEAYTIEARARKPSLRPEWCLNPGEPACLLPPGFGVIEQRERPDREYGPDQEHGGGHGEGRGSQDRAIRRSLLARRLGPRERRST